MIGDRDPHGVWNGEKIEFTLHKLCNIIYKGAEYSLPEPFEAIADKPILRVTADNTPARSGLRVVFDLSWNTPEEDSAVQILNYLKSGVIIVTAREFLDDNDEPYAVIKVEDVWEAWIALGRYVKDLFPMPTIGLTGSAGKTTSTMFAECVFNERYKTFVSGLDGRNFNSTLQIVNQWILRINPEYSFHVQECGAETLKLVESSARVINADGFGITNIDTTQHIATYETAENLIADKTSFDRVRKDTTFGVINLDDEILKNYKFESPIITFAIHDTRADYVGTNIVQNGEILEFDVVSKGECVPIKIHIIGKHNVYNALMVFAFAKKFGLTNEEIQRGFLNYESVGIRQYLRQVAGRYLYMDAYNASPESTQLSIQALEEIKVPKGGRRIAVIGERKTSNEETFEINYKLGQDLAKFKQIDEFVIVGEDPKRMTGAAEKIEPENAQRYRTALYSGACSVIEDESRLSYCTDLGALAARLRYQTKPGDAILFKGRHHLSLWCIADMAFGTAYTKMNAVAPLPVKKSKIALKSYTGENYPCFSGINLLTATNGFDNTQIFIPDMLNKIPVVRITDRAFAKKSQLRLVKFGANIRAIGDSAFAECTRLEQIELPKPCIYIGASAFEGCCSMVRAGLLGVGHISKAAFRGCEKLKKVILSDKCATIEVGAFDGCTDLRICAPADSYAANWAVKNGFAVEVIDASEELAKLAKNGTRSTPHLYGLEKYESDAVSEENKSKGGLSTANLSVVVAGDIMVHDHQLVTSFNSATSTYNFEKLFANTRKYFKAADIAIGNVETVLGSGAYTGFPRFNTPDALADSLKNAGFDIAACANNHIFDVNYAGIPQTRRTLEARGLAVAGIRKEEKEKGYVIVERKGIKIALINFTYLTPYVNGQKTLNTYPLDAMSAQLINTFSTETLDTDLLDVKSEIDDARAAGAQIVLVYYHWGAEYERISNTLQRYIAYRTAKMGADAILGSHAHVLQEKSEIKIKVDGKEKIVPVFYGLGNYCWGARLPRTGRESVQNGALAKLDIEYDKRQRRVLSIKTGYIPLTIRADYIYNKFDFNVLSLNDMTQEEIEVFNERSSTSLDEIRADIARSISGKLRERKTVRSFDRVIYVQLGARINITRQTKNRKVIVPEKELVALRSENAPVASVLQNGDIIGNANGFAGIRALRTDGKEVCFVVKVIGTADNTMPVLVDRYNLVPDIYRPKNMVSGKDALLPAGAGVEGKTAQAWMNMRTSAAEAGVYICCVSGYRTNEGQLKKHVACDEQFGKGASAERYAPMGHSEHHLGTALDVTNVTIGARCSTREAAFAWLMRNASLFGFVIRHSESADHMHLHYVGSPALAKYMRAHKLSIGECLMKYKDFMKHLEAAEKWKTVFLSEEEIHAPQEQWTQLTLRRLCQLLEMEVPSWYIDIQDRVIPAFSFLGAKTTPGGVVLAGKLMTKRFRSQSIIAINNGAALLITNSPAKDASGRMLPQLLVDDLSRAFVKIGTFLRRSYQGTTVCIMEEGGEHVLRERLYELLSPGFKIYRNTRGADSQATLLSALQTLSQDDQIFLQNVQAKYTNYITQNAEVIAPDVAVLMKTKAEFPEAYGEEENYLADRAALVEQTLQRGGMVFVDADDDALLERFDRCEVVTFSRENPDADYLLEQVTENRKTLEIFVRRKQDNVVIAKRVAVDPEMRIDQLLAACAVSDVLLKRR